jgi:hypothetical protein
MKPMNDRTSSRLPSGSPAPRQRFRLTKLEERIAPSKGKGAGPSKNCTHGPGPCLY